MVYRTRVLPIAALAAGLATAPVLGGTAFAQMAAPPNPPQGSQGGSQAMPPATDQTMPAQQMSQATITKAGHALRNVVAINKMYGQKLSKTTDPAAKQQLVAAAKQKAMGAITSQGLTVGQYNQVLASAEQNPSMRQQLLNAAGITTKN